MRLKKLRRKVLIEENGCSIIKINNFSLNHLTPKEKQRVNKIGVGKN